MATSFGDMNKLIKFCNDNNVSINVEYYMSDLKMRVAVSSTSAELNCEVDSAVTAEKFITSWISCLNNRANGLTAQLASVNSMLKNLIKY